MSEQIPSVSMELNQQMLTDAVTAYIQTKLFGRPVNVVSIDFVAGRKTNGHSANIEISFGNTTSIEGDLISEKGKVGNQTPLQETVVEEAPDSGDADIALAESDDEALEEDSNEEAPTAKKQKRLFVADS